MAGEERERRMAQNIKVVRDILEASRIEGGVLRREFDASNVFVANIVSSPGAGKTTILEKTRGLLGSRFKLGVIVGDLETSRDAERLTDYDEVVQVNTDGGCHLTTAQVRAALGKMRLGSLDALFIENVGNLVCPANFFLGEHARIVVASVAEGDDKPIKYPGVFHSADLVVLNKMDLAGLANFDMARFERDLRSVSPKSELIKIAAFRETGLEAWVEWVEKKIVSKRRARG
jgi:hydrogenase nickel incorporation protein HypB